MAKGVGINLAFGRLASILLAVAGWLLAGGRAMLDLIGYSTAPEDIEAAQSRLDQFLDLVLSAPWWAFWAFALVSTILLIWVSWPRPKGASTSGGEQPSEGATPSLPLEPKTQPIFGHPVQTASENYLSWWHIPISVSGPGGSPGAVIEHCTVEMELAFSTIPLRWQADNEPRGVEEIVLVEGVDRMVPVAIRCETGANGARIEARHQPIADGIARITGPTYLRDGDMDKAKADTLMLRSGDQFKLRVRSGKRSWESRCKFLLRIPQDIDDSNGSFILETKERYYGA